MKRNEMERFEALCQKEPGLRALYERARAVRDDKLKPVFCANNLWVNELKPVLLELVGWEARNPTLAGSGDYDLAYDTIYATLPPCRNCSCYGADAGRKA